MVRYVVYFKFCLRDDLDGGSVLLCFVHNNVELVFQQIYEQTKHTSLLCNGLTRSLASERKQILSERNVVLCHLIRFQVNGMVF